MYNIIKFTNYYIFTIRLQWKSDFDIKTIDSCIFGPSELLSLQQVFFVESVCNDPEAVAANILVGFCVPSNTQWFDCDLLLGQTRAIHSYPYNEGCCTQRDTEKE